LQHRGGGFFGNSGNGCSGSRRALSLPWRDRSCRGHAVRVEHARRAAEIRGFKKEQHARGHDDSRHQQRTEILLPRWPKRELIGSPGRAVESTGFKQAINE
jgi:hypothetical protein